jgi:flagellum-specific peptidoglycan hydrolase FlgJ
MNTNYVFRSLFIVYVMISSLLTTILSGQVSSSDSCVVLNPTKDSVVALSNRIAVSYGADALIIERFVQAAVDLEFETDIAAMIVIAIAIHESGFKSALFINAGNPFGIKASGDWDGATYTKQDDGAASRFRVYTSPEAAVRDFGFFVNSRSWYTDALTCEKDNYFCVVDGLKKTDTELGYSSNPLWDEAILDIIEKVGLQHLVTYQYCTPREQ